MSNLIQDIKQSLYKGFIDKDSSHKGNFVPRLLVNNKEENVLSTIIDQLHNCQSFCISVAFITESGLASLKSHFYDLSKKGVKGRIITSNYLGFNSPKMFEELLKLENVEVKLTNIEGFHAKGYIFEHHNHTSFIIGSSNLTSNALKLNYEHNLFLSTHKNGDLVNNIKYKFDELWDSSFSLTNEWINEYKQSFEYQTLQKVFDNTVVQNSEIKKFNESKLIKPNLMQEHALKSLESLRNVGGEKGLIISATGTGKTILCALDVRAYSPDKFLFIVHNEGILNRAIEEFKKVFPYEDESNFGLLTGKRKDHDAKFLFATIQTLSKKENYKLFNSNHFDYIVFDEAHRIAASSYQKIFNYFKPNFLLGMTATPERTDELNIFELFNYNIAYEIRLQEALESNILCPFHYFGVTDYIQNEMSQEDAFNLKYLASNERVEHIIKKTNYYGYSGDVLKGLIFVSSRGEAYQLANQLSKRGISSVGLTGKDSIAYRTETIQQLKEGSINYIITVDLFNEGIDIPEINQVVMLRPTKSSIIFIQQLGRGLRKSTNKEFVTVIDFIGNYKTNYMIPIALSGNKSQNKDNYRKFLTDTTVLNGVSTINFEEVAKNKIYNSLDSVKLNQPKLIKEAFNNVKDRIGKLPLLMDFINNDSIDPSVIFSRFKNYYEFLIKNKIIENELSINEFKNLTFLSRQLSPGLKKVDIDVLKEVIQNDVTYENLTKKMLNINNDISEYDINTSLSILDFTFFKKTIGKTYGLPLIQYKDNLICLANEFKEALNKPLFNTFVHDLIDLANYNNDRYQNKKNSLILYNKYSREDFVKLLNWDKDESGTINGYRMKHRTLPLFITYDKHENISDNTKYDDEFLSQDELKWYTRSNRKLTSPEVQNILKHEENNTDMYIFVKKRDDEGKYFYYLGKAKYIKGTEKQDYMPNGNSVVTMHLSMNTSIRDDIYRYIT